MFSYSFTQVISALAYLVHFIDGYQQYWLRTAWGFDNEVSFYYICGKLLNHSIVNTLTCFCVAVGQNHNFIDFYNSRIVHECIPGTLQLHGDSFGFVENL